METVCAFTYLDVPFTFELPSSLLQSEGSILNRLPERGRGNTSGALDCLLLNDVLEEPLESAFDTFDSVLH